MLIKLRGNDTLLHNAVHANVICYNTLTRHNQIVRPISLERERNACKQCGAFRNFDPRGVLQEKLCDGVRPASQNPYPSYLILKSAIFPTLVLTLSCDVLRPDP